MINKILVIIFGWCLQTVSLLLRKDKNVWIFGAWHGKRFSDNSKYFFEYCDTVGDNKKYIWISLDKKTIEKVRSKGNLAYHAHSILGIYYQMIAGVAFVTHSIYSDLFSPCVSKNTIVVQLWHGLALKKIMYDTPNLTRLSKRISDFTFPFTKHRYDYVVATSKETSRIFSQAFKVDLGRIINSGMPRNDSLFCNHDCQGKDTINYKVIYMPTYRSQDTTNSGLFTGLNFDIERLDNELNENGIDFYIRLHPMNRPSGDIIKSIDMSKRLHFEDSEDIYETICNYDCLVTDFSSIYLDFMLTGKPIIFAPFKFEDYLSSERELYYDYKDVTPGPYCYNWKQLVKKISKVKNSGLESEEKSAQIAIQNLFHDHIDDQSSKRLFDDVNIIISRMGTEEK